MRKGMDILGLNFKEIGRDRKCEVAECGRPHRSLGFCSTHYTQHQRGHDPHTYISPSERKCQVEGCEQKHGGLGLCKRHYQQTIKHGQTHLGYRGDKHPCPIADCESLTRTGAKLCARHQKVSYRYKIPLDKMLKLHEEARTCGICGASGQMRVDHDHACCPQSYGTCGNCNRGLICASCNTALGMAKDSPQILERLAEYLRANPRI
jgi:hypothetical protein